MEIIIDQIKIPKTTWINLNISFPKLNFLIQMIADILIFIALHITQMFSIAIVNGHKLLDNAFHILLI